MANQSTKGLRFAPLIRVSTEGQEKKGESLETQTKQIKQYVEHLEGVIPDHCWKYRGQEHATADFERKKFDTLLQDAQKGLFDAVIVVDASRWSRDNGRSKEGLEVLRRSGVRFFTGTLEQDLHNPNQTFFLGISAEVGEYQANIQTLKSIQSRIERARRGLPVSGKLPFGRTFNKKTGKWGLDKKKAKDIQWAAEQYLAGRSRSDIAKTLGMKEWTLWNVLRNKSGSVWEQGLACAKLNIDETIATPIPPLLPEETIQAVAEKSEANKTYSHGQRRKYFYLLRSVVFCAKCGYAMFGQMNHKRTTRTRYYRHAHTERVIECDKGISVRADALENAVMSHIFEMLGDAPSIEAAANEAIPDKERIEKLRKDREHFENELEGIKRKVENLVDAVAEGTLPREEVRAKREELRDQEARINSELEAINGQLEHIPAKEDVRRKAAALTRARIRRRRYSSYDHFLKMSDDDKRTLVEMVLGGKDASGKKLGVYITKDDAGVIHYEILGNLPEVVSGSLPMSEDEQRYRQGGLSEEALIIELSDAPVTIDEARINLEAERAERDADKGELDQGAESRVGSSQATDDKGSTRLVDC